MNPRRITQASQTKDTARGSGMLPNIQVEYPTVCPFNCDNTRLLLLHFSYFALYDGEGKYLFDCTEEGRFEVNASSRPRWSMDDPDIFYYFHSNQVKTYNVKARSSALLHTFSEYSAIDDGGEADIATDGRCRVLCGDNKEIFVFNLKTSQVGPKLAIEGHVLNNLYLAADGYQFLVGWSEYGTGPFQGIWIYDWDLLSRRNLAPVLGHMDTGRDADGSDVMIWASGADKARLCGMGGTGIVKIPLNGNPPNCITTFGWDVALHISCPVTRNGEFFVSTYGAKPGAIYRSSMKAGALEKLIDLTQVVKSYDQEPKVSCSRDGSKLAYIEGNDVWLVDLHSSSPLPVPSAPSTPLPIFIAPHWSFSQQGGVLYRDNEVIGYVHSAEAARAIVEKMNQ